MPKTYADTYLFRQYSNYERKMLEFIMNAERIDTSADNFDDVVFDFKRRNTTRGLLKVLNSKNVVVGIRDGNPLPKAFKVFVAKDVKVDKNKHKAFIDVTDCMVNKGGMWDCLKIDWLVSYVINAMTSMVYTVEPQRLLGNSSVLKDGGEAFTRCFSYIMDRMYKLTTVQQLKKRVDYAVAMYYQVNLLERDFEKNFDSIKANAMRIADIESRDAQIVDIDIAEEDFKNLDTFVKALGRIFNLKDLKTSNVVALWMQAFGTGTVFALEYFPAFSMMMTNTYVGGYIDNQITIEKVAGNAMVSFTKTVMQIGEQA